MYGYSKSTNSIYDLSIVYPKVPDDTVNISRNDFQKILIAREENRQIEFIDGMITISEPCPGAFYEWNSESKKWLLNQDRQSESEKKQNESKKTTLLLNSKEQIDLLQDELELDLSDNPEHAKGLLKNWRIYRVKLNKVDTSNPDWPEAPN